MTVRGPASYCISSPCHRGAVTSLQRSSERQIESCLSSSLNSAIIVVACDIRCFSRHNESLRTVTSRQEYVVFKYYFHPPFSIYVNYNIEHVMFWNYILNVCDFSTINSRNTEKQKSFLKNLGMERVHLLPF
jgi:hypothetical protein